MKTDISKKVLNVTIINLILQEFLTILSNYYNIVCI